MAVTGRKLTVAVEEYFAELRRVRATGGGTGEPSLFNLKKSERAAPTVRLLADAPPTLAAASAAPYSHLSQVGLPQSAPSLKILSRECRWREFDCWFELVPDNPRMDSRAAQVLAGERDELRRTFVDGDTRGFLEPRPTPLQGHLIDATVSSVRRNL